MLPRSWLPRSSALSSLPRSFSRASDAPLSALVVYAAFAGVALLVSEHIDKPLVQRIYDGESTFPSGSVTLAGATALAMWLALYPLLGDSVPRSPSVSARPGSC